MASTRSRSALDRRRRSLQSTCRARATRGTSSRRRPPSSPGRSSPAARARAPTPRSASSTSPGRRTRAASTRSSSRSRRRSSRARRRCRSRTSATATHVLEVRATTPFGIVEEPPAEYEWTVDAVDETPPETEIDLGPANGSTSTNTTETFVFGGTDNLTAALELAFECRLDGDLDTAWQDCESGFQIVDLTLGAHTFEVRAVDLAGNADASPASRTWTRVAGLNNTLPGAPVVLTFPIQGGGTATVTFAEVTGAGHHVRNRAHRFAALPAGYVSTGAVYYDVSTTATYAGDISVCLPYDPSSLDEPRLLHFDGSEWVEITTSIDQANGISCGITDGLSPFGIAEAEPALAPTTQILEGPGGERPRDRARSRRGHVRVRLERPAGRVRVLGRRRVVELVRQPVRLRGHGRLARAPRPREEPERRDRRDARGPVYLDGRGEAARRDRLGSRRRGSGAARRPEREQRGDLRLHGRPALDVRVPPDERDRRLDVGSVHLTAELRRAGDRQRVHVRGPGQERGQPRQREPPPGRVRVGGRRPDRARHDHPEQAERPDHGHVGDVHLLGERARDVRVLARRRRLRRLPGERRHVHRARSRRAHVQRPRDRPL